MATLSQVEELFAVVELDPVSDEVDRIAVFVGVVEELSFGLSEGHLSGVPAEVFEALLRDYPDEVGRITQCDEHGDTHKYAGEKWIVLVVCDDEVECEVAYLLLPHLTVYEISTTSKNLSISLPSRKVQYWGIRANLSRKILSAQ